MPIYGETSGKARDPILTSALMKEPSLLDSLVKEGNFN